MKQEESSTERIIERKKREECMKYLNRSVVKSGLGKLYLSCNCQAIFMTMNLKGGWVHFAHCLPSSALFGSVYADIKVAVLISPDFWYL